MANSLAILIGFYFTYEELKRDAEDIGAISKAVFTLPMRNWNLVNNELYVS